MAKITQKAKINNSIISANHYLNFNGNTEEAFNFYKSVFGGEFLIIQRLKDTPKEVQKNIPKKELNKILFISLAINKNVRLIGTEAPESMGFKLIEGNNHHISLEIKDKKTATKIFKKLSKGGEIEYSIQDMFWGAYFGSFKDKFGINWMISYEYPKK